MTRETFCAVTIEHGITSFFSCLFKKNDVYIKCNYLLYLCVYGVEGNIVRKPLS